METIPKFNHKARCVKEAKTLLVGLVIAAVVIFILAVYTHIAFPILTGLACVAWALVSMRQSFTLEPRQRAVLAPWVPWLDPVVEGTTGVDTVRYWSPFRYPCIHDVDTYVYEKNGKHPLKFVRADGEEWQARLEVRFTVQGFNPDGTTNNVGYAENSVLAMHDNGYAKFGKNWLPYVWYRYFTEVVEKRVLSCFDGKTETQLSPANRDDLAKEVIRAIRRDANYRNFSFILPDPDAPGADAAFIRRVITIQAVEKQVASKAKRVERVVAKEKRTEKREVDKEQRLQARQDALYAQLKADFTPPNATPEQIAEAAQKAAAAAYKTGGGGNKKKK